MNGIVLAGGKATRLNGIEKGMIIHLGKPIIEHLIHLLQLYVKEIIIVSNTDAYNYLKTNTIEIIPDTIKNIGPLGGIYSGLIHSNAEKNIILACDTPFINASVINNLLSVSEEYDIIVSECNEVIHPLCGIYSKKIIPVMENMIQSGNFKVKELLKKVNILKVHFPNEYTTFFTNINTPDDLKLMQ